MSDAMVAYLDKGTYKSTSTEVTQALGELLGGLLKAGDALVLSGDLGAGKTQLTKGIARALQIESDVLSPTFTIEMIHHGSELDLFHFDLYRLKDASELDETGLWDALEDDGVTIIEWGETFEDELPDERLNIVIERMDSEALEGQEPSRMIRLLPLGARMQKLVQSLDDLVKNND